MKEITDKIDQAMAALAEARAFSVGQDQPPAPARWSVKNGASLQAAHDSCPEGLTIEVEPGTYQENLVVTKRHTWQPTVSLPKIRATKDSAQVRVVGDSCLTNKGSDAAFLGFQFKTTSKDGTPITDVGTNLLLDRCVVLGEPKLGAHRGMLAHGTGARVVRSYFDDIFDIGRDTQAICGWDGTLDLGIDDCYLSAAGETVMFGGADSTSDARIPRRILITNSTLTKNPAWFSLGMQIKNCFELKSARDVIMRDCILEYAGTSAGQGAYLFAMTVRNQNGKAPWSTIENVLIERCRATHAGGGINFLGVDNNNPSGRMRNVVFRNVALTDLDPKGITKGDGRGFIIQAAPDGVVLENVTFEGQNLGAAGYFIAPPPTNFTMRNVKLPVSKYGLKIDAHGGGLVDLAAWMPDATFDRVATDAVGATGYPA